MSDFKSIKQEQRGINQSFYQNRGPVLRLDYDFLTPDSLVLDVGGFVGDWAHDIHAKYGCQVFILEPVLGYVQKLVTRFRGNSKIQVFPVGLGGTTRDDRIAINGNASSMFLGRPWQRQLCRIVAVNEFMERHGISGADLMKVNIEGAEYELFKNMIEHDLLGSMRAYQIQFHRFVSSTVIPGARQNMEAVWRELEKTHALKWQFLFCFESWERRL